MTIKEIYLSTGAMFAEIKISGNKAELIENLNKEYFFIAKLPNGQAIVINPKFIVSLEIDG
jgi:hypothetical protein